MSKENKNIVIEVENTEETNQEVVVKENFFEKAKGVFNDHKKAIAVGTAVVVGVVVAVVIGKKVSADDIPVTDLADSVTPDLVDDVADVAEVTEF